MSDWIAGLFGEGTLFFRGISPRYFMFGLLCAGVLVALGFRLQSGAARRWKKALTFSLRLLAFILVLLVLTEPVLRTEEAIPQQSFVAHVFDTSGSMSIKDYDGQTRIEALAKRAKESKSRAEIDYLFKGLDFSFDDGLLLIDQGEKLEAKESPTDLVGAMRNLQMQINGLPMSGVVLYSDGNPTLNNNLDAIMDAAGKLETPIYCVGSAPLTPGPDIWVEEVICPEEALKGVASTIRALIGTRDIKSRGIEVKLLQGEDEIDSVILHSTEKEQVLSAAFKIQPDTLGLSHYRISVETHAKESYPWNNTEDFFINVVQKRYRVLYVEGYPRYEYRFLRAAFEDDSRFQVTSMVSVNPRGKTYRQGLSDKSELSKGFPNTEKDLFKYDVVVLGDVAAHNFSPSQLTALKNFVSNKGGGLLFLAGENSFDPNGFARTELASVLPFKFSASQRYDDDNLVTPTSEGIDRALFGPYEPKYDPKPPWAALPPISGLYSLGDLRPGAVTLCSIELGKGAENPPVVAYQRYGQGTSLICGVGATWQWRFQTPSNNPSYEAFWKEMMLVLLEQSRSRLQVKAVPPFSPLGSEVALQTSVLDREFIPDPTAHVVLEIEPPQGGILVVTPHLDADAAGATFKHRIMPSQPGLYKVTARTESGEAGVEALEHETMFMVKEDVPELREIRLNEALLRRISASTGGAYIHLSEYNKLPGMIDPREGSLHKIAALSLWDRPSVLIILLGLILAEWLIRRISNMA